ncbi:hypothetical protein AMECASPLE_022556 [Ameca splendens]|uniref:Uncharacterized protein n=1 Tax=Ameca splendens TaxID=208324 RepID=A0ABV0ZNN2_9TELE
MDFCMYELFYWILLAIYLLLFLTHFSHGGLGHLCVSMEERKCISLCVFMSLCVMLTHIKSSTAHTHTHLPEIDESNLRLTFSVRRAECVGLGVGVLKQETQDGY